MKRKPEQWKTIKDYPNYMISSWGRVWSESNLSAKGPHILPVQSNHNGYYRVRLWKHNHVSSKRINRLVAQAFVPNPHHYPIVNHKDENKRNNYYKNLEWCTAKYNTDYSLKRHPERQKSYFNKKYGGCTSYLVFKGLYNCYYFNSAKEVSRFLFMTLQSFQALRRNHNYIQGWYILSFGRNFPRNN